MARRPAPTGTTGGAGYDFEDKVCAYYAAALLAHENVMDEECGPLVRIDFQTRVLGWLLDDALLTFAKGNRLALSIKSNDQITSNGLPRSFTSDIWEQHLQMQGQPFDPNRDLLVLVTSPPGAEIRSSLQTLIRNASVQDADRFLAELGTPYVSSDLKRDLFASLRCPANLAQAHAGMERDEEVFRLFRRLRFFDFDFSFQPSRSETEAKRSCQNMMDDASPGTAKDLWESLITIVHDQRIKGGYLDARRILNHLQGRFRLRQWPEFRGDVEAISRWTTTALARIPDRIGFTVHLPRTNDVSKIAQSCSQGHFLAVTGPSGCGKSVLLKLWAAALSPAVPVLWLEGKYLGHSGVHQLRNDLGLSHPLSDLSISLTSETAYCVIDGAGSISTDDGYRNAADIIRALKVGDGNSPWRVIVITQQEEWNRFFQEINGAYGDFLKWERVYATNPTVQDAQAVVQAFPKLSPLVFQPELRSFLLRPKILDLVARRAVSDDEVSPETWLGESSMALWFWETQVAKKPAVVGRAQAALAFAQMQADRLSADVPVAEVPVALDDLINDGIVVNQQGRLSFQHDLYGDWARLQILISERENVAEFVESKLTSPFWNRAVRLYGLYLLEQEEGASRWLETMNRLGESRGSGLAQDLILESVLFGANAESLLEMLWPVLCADQGFLLRRLLGRFLYVATEPNPLKLRLAKTPTEHLRMATQDREPYWPYWLPMMRFLRAHKDEVIPLAAQAVAEVCLTWLERTPSHWPVRVEAAEVAIALAKHHLAREWDAHRDENNEVASAFRAALAGVREKPKEVRDFALRACGRLTRPGKPPVARKLRPARRLTQPPGLRRRKRGMRPWRHGPSQAVNPNFAKVCLGEPGLFTLTQANPELTGEILLGLLINPPRQYDVEWGYSFMEKAQACEINDHHPDPHYPPFYWHFPWYQFLRCNPTHAIRTIVRLVNFASARYSAYLGRLGQHTFRIEVPVDETKHIWAGDQETYLWHTAIFGPHAVSSALMSMENWLYERLGAGDSVDEYIQQIAIESRSIAFAGLLATVACRHKELLKGPLQFLMGVAEFLFLERMKPVHFRPTTALIAWTGQHEDSVNYAREWYAMAHRTSNLDEVARQMFLTDLGTHAFFLDVRQTWQQKQDDLRQSGDEDGADFVGRLISAFTPEHYSFELSEEHQGILVTHQFPDELAAQSRQNAEAAELGLLRITYPQRCRQILDGEVSLDGEKVFKFWHDCQRILTVEFDGDPIIHPLNAACGCAAVLLLRHGDWLAGDEEKQEWCVETLLSTTESPPPAPSFDTDADVSRWNWFNFCAETIPSLWAKDRNSPRLRVCILLLALDLHHTAVAGLFSACFIERQTLGEDFYRLQALLRHWAAEKVEVSRREDGLFNNNIFLRPEERRSFRAVAALDADIRNQLLSADFVNGLNAFLDASLPSTLPPLVDRNRAPQPIMHFQDRFRRERLRRSCRTDMELIQASYTFLPLQLVQGSEQERQEWTGLWEELLGAVLYTLQPLTSEDEHQEIDGLPYEFDRWVMNNIAVLILQMRIDEHPERLWQSVMDLGWEAHHWVETFFSGFFTYGLQIAMEENLSQHFISTWSAMIEYAENSAVWNHQPDIPDWHISDNWQHLMGMGGTFLATWHDAYSHVLATMAPRLRTYCEKRINGGDVLGRFIALLRRPASIAFRIEALEWIEPHFDQADEYFWKSSEAHGQLRLLLAEMWQEQRNRVRQRSQTFSCFRRLVKLLADRQDTLAMEIQSRIVAT